MRTRWLAIRFLVPTLVVVAVAAGFAVHAASQERDAAVALSRELQRNHALDDVRTWVMGKEQQLLALEAFTSIPPNLAQLAPGAAAYAQVTDDSNILMALDYADAQGVAAMQRLAAMQPVPAAVAQVLKPLSREVRDALRDGDAALLDPGPYDQAYAWVVDQTQQSQNRTNHADAALRDAVRRPPLWRTWEFAAFVGLMLAIGVGGALLGTWRVAANARALDRDREDANRDVERMAARAEHLRLLISLGRRLSTDADLDSVAGTLVAETKQLLAPEVAALLQVRDGQLVPVAAQGPIVPSSVPVRAGIAGRAAESGVPVRMVVSGDPLFPAGAGPMSMMAAPLTHDGRVSGVLVVATAGEAMYDSDAETLIGLVATLGAGAIGSAERFGSTLALALDDALTGLGNRRRLDHDLAKLLPTGRRGPVSFLMIDIDHFKIFNDRFGHPAGDALLRSVAASIGGALRQGDTAYRFGGEEFCVVLPSTDHEAASAIAERIRFAVAAMGSSPSERVTVSVGVATATDDEAPDALVDEADRALYHAKRAGRDRVVTSGRFGRRSVA